MAFYLLHNYMDFIEISDNKVNRTDYFQSIILLSKIMQLDEFYFFRRKL